MLTFQSVSAPLLSSISIALGFNLFFSIMAIISLLLARKWRYYWIPFLIGTATTLFSVVAGFVNSKKYGTPNNQNFVNLIVFVVLVILFVLLIVFVKNRPVMPKNKKAKEVVKKYGYGRGNIYLNCFTELITQFGSFEDKTKASVYDFKPSLYYEIEYDHGKEVADEFKTFFDSYRYDTELIDFLAGKEPANAIKKSPASVSSKPAEQSTLSTNNRSETYINDTSNTEQVLLQDKDQHTIGSTSESCSHNGELKAETMTKLNTESISTDATLPEKKKIVFCHKCGSKLKPDSVFCSFCGARIISEKSNND